MDDRTLGVILLCLTGVMLISGMSFMCGAILATSHETAPKPAVTWEVLGTGPIGDVELDRTSIVGGYIYRHRESITFVPNECQ